MSNAIYRRVLLKISGEALAGEKHVGLDFDMVGRVADVIGALRKMDVQVGVVIGGGNFWRGAKNSGGHMERTRGDRMGMLATVMNCLAVCDVCEQKGIPARVLTASEMEAIAEFYNRERAVDYLEAGKVVFFAGGTGNPFFSTDTGAVLRAAEIGADVILLAKNIDGVYSSDPRIDPTATRFDRITFAEVLERRLTVMDLTATALAQDQKLKVLLFALEDPENILRAVRGEDVGTLVYEPET